MSVLSQIAKPKDRAVAVTILSDAGIGKTSLAATFPNPIFIRAEDGMQSIPANNRPDAFPLLQNVEQLWEQLTALINEKHDYKTVVIDSVTALERLFTQYVIDSDPKKPKSINQAMGGYGAGLAAVGSMHGRVRKAAGMLIEKGVNVVFIAHADTIDIDLPDSDPYTKYSMRLGKRSTAPYLDDVDVVAFLKLEAFTKDNETGKAKAFSDGTRLMICYASAAYPSKNRFGIEHDLIMKKGENPLVDFIGILSKH